MKIDGMYVKYTGRFQSRMTVVLNTHSLADVNGISHMIMNASLFLTAYMFQSPCVAIRFDYGRLPHFHTCRYLTIDPWTPATRYIHCFRTAMKTHQPDYDRETITRNAHTHAATNCVLYFRVHMTYMHVTNLNFCTKWNSLCCFQIQYLFLLRNCIRQDLYNSISNVMW